MLERAVSQQAHLTFLFRVYCLSTLSLTEKEVPRQNTADEASAATTDPVYPAPLSVIPANQSLSDPSILLSRRTTLFFCAVTYDC